MQVRPQGARGSDALILPAAAVSNGITSTNRRQQIDARPMDRLANAVILSWGWRRRGIAFFAGGALSALAMPPFFAFPILWVTLPVLVWLIDGAVAEAQNGRVRRLGPAFAIGWWFGFGYFLAGLWWVGAAFLVEADEFGWLMPLACSLLPAGLALFWGFGVGARAASLERGLAAHLRARRRARRRRMAARPPPLRLSLERHRLRADRRRNPDAVGGALRRLCARTSSPSRSSPRRRRWRRPSASGGATSCCPRSRSSRVAALGLYGVLRLSQAATAFVPDVTIRIVQPALDQLQKWDPDNKDEVLSTYFRLSAPEGAPLAKGTLLVWPESAFPFPLTQDPGVLAAIAELLPEGTALVTGAYREEYPPSGERQVFNSIYVIGDDGTILDAYDKVHLVPFGEYLPARRAPRRARASASSCRAASRRARSGARFTLPFAPPSCRSSATRSSSPARSSARDRGRPSCST